MAKTPKKTNCNIKFTKDTIDKWCLFSYFPDMKPEQHNDEIVTAIDDAIDVIDKKIEANSPLHIRDHRAEPDDGYGNYMTIVEAQLLGILNADLERQRSEFVAVRRNLMENL